MKNYLFFFIAVLIFLVTPVYSDLTDDLEDSENEEIKSDMDQESKKKPPKPLTNKKLPKSSIKTVKPNIEENTQLKNGTNPPKNKIRIVKTAPENKNDRGNKGPITYQAEKILKFQNNDTKSILDLVKDVEIKQGPLTLLSDSARIILIPEGKGKKAVDSITITGNVRVQRYAKESKDRVTARGDKAVFKNNKRTVTLIGNAVVVKGDQTVRGNKVEYDLRTGQIAITGAKGTLQPEGLNK